MFGKLIFIFFSLSLISCAKPNYQDPPLLTSDHLAFGKTQIEVSLEWEKLPTETEFGSLFLRFYNDHGMLTSLGALQPSVVLWMPSMGHGSSPVTMEKISDGLYHATRVFFIMPGQWEIRIQLKDQDHVVDQITKQITI